MANYQPVSPYGAASGVTLPDNPAAASDTYDVQPNSRYLLELRNAGGTANNVKIDDANTVGAVGATVVQDPDVTVVVPITTGHKTYLIDTNRFRDNTTGKITFTNSFLTTNTHNLIGPL
jgi:hypothetical protein